MCNCAFWPQSNDLCQRGYIEHKLFGRHYLGANRTTMSSAVHTLTQVKACFSIMVVVVSSWWCSYRFIRLLLYSWMDYQVYAQNLSSVSTAHWLSSALFLIEGVHCSRRRKSGALHLIDIVWLSPGYRSGEEGDILLVQMIASCRRCAYRSDTVILAYYVDVLNSGNNY